MRYRLIDTILERTETRLVAIKQVSLAEEYLWDHFPGFPVLPGVLMLESMVQAAAELAGEPDRLVLGSVRALKYGAFVMPGQTLRVEIDRVAVDTLDFSGRGLCFPAGQPNEPTHAVAGKFSLRPRNLLGIEAIQS